MMNKEYLELTELQAAIKDGLSELFPDKYWVRAEIREFSPRANGHCYLSLGQSSGGKVLAEARAVIWKWNYPMLKAFFEETVGEPLRSGITVLVRVQVSYSELYGVSLFIDDIDPSFTVGEKALEKQRIVRKLSDEGYMDMQRELCLPRIPRRLAVISAKTAAGLGDFMNHLTGNPYGYVFEVDLLEALMQGESAPASISDAIAKAAGGAYDAVLILRGGGSEMDLACFDDYDLAVAIATCPVPVLTAIGHERDYHIADMVANRFVKTPTALADVFLDIFGEEDAALGQFAARIRQAAGRRITDEFRRVDLALQRLKFSMGAILGRELSALALKETVIASSDPRNILSRGYVLVTDGQGRVLKSARRISPGDRIGVRFSDGSLSAEVTGVLPSGEDSASEIA